MNKTQKQARRKRIQEHERLRKLEKRRAVEAEEMDELEETAAVERYLASSPALFRWMPA